MIFQLAEAVASLMLRIIPRIMLLDMNDRINATDIPTQHKVYVLDYYARLPGQFWGIGIWQASCLECCSKSQRAAQMLEIFGTIWHPGRRTITRMARLLLGQKFSLLDHKIWK